MEQTATARTDIDQIIARSRVAAQTFASREGFDSVFLGGAPWAGLGSPKSDTDVFVVVDGSKVRPTEQVYESGMRLDVEYISWSSMEALVQLVATYDVRADDMTQLTAASRNALESLTRFLLGEIVLDLDGRLQALLGRLIEAHDNYTRVLLARHATDTLNLAEDVEGALAMGLLESADYGAREALYRSAEAYLARHRDPYVKSKWVWSKWQRTAAHRFEPEITTYLSDPHRPNMADAVLSSRWLSQDLFVMALTGIDYPPVLEVQAGSLRRLTGHTPIEIVDGFLILRDVEEGIDLSWQGLLLWGAAHGRTKAEAVDVVHALLEKAGESAPLEDVADYLDSLIDGGLLSTAGAST